MEPISRRARPNTSSSRTTWKRRRRREKWGFEIFPIETIDASCFFPVQKGEQHTQYIDMIYIYICSIYIQNHGFSYVFLPIWNCLKTPVLPRTSPFPSKDVDRSFLFPCSRREQEVEAQILWYSLVSHTVEPSHVASHASCRAVIAVENITKVAAHEFHLAQRRGSTSPDPEPSRGTPDAFPWWSAGFHQRSTSSSLVSDYFLILMTQLSIHCESYHILSPRSLLTVPSPSPVPVSARHGVWFGAHVTIPPRSVWHRGTVPPQKDAEVIHHDSSLS